LVKTLIYQTVAFIMCPNIQFNIFIT